MFENLLRKFVQFIDPKLEKYRPPKAPAAKYAPKTLAEFIGVLKRTPQNILNAKDRSRIAAIMNFDERKVKDLMTSKDKLVFVNYKEILGPLTLDKLYKSGFTNFPVVNNHGKVIGVIHTEALNALEIKKTDRAEKYMDKNISYLHETDSLNFVIEEIERTNSYYFLVQDARDVTVGCFTIQTLLDYLLGNQ